ncbi:MAG TPA: 3'-5' exonuclease [Candidatus Obscuribacterales bacterium]
MRSNIANVLDLELTCYEDGVFPEGERAEVIEFGITMVDLPTRTILKTLSIPVIPTMSTVSPFCARLTGWTPAKLNRSGVPYAEACRRILEKYGGRNRLLVVDSDDETEIVRVQCALSGNGIAPVEYPFGTSQLNVSTLFELLTGEKSNVGLDKMLELLGLQFEGRRHRAGDDSKNIARVLLKLLEKGSFKL